MPTEDSRDSLKELKVKNDLSHYAGQIYTQAKKVVDNELTIHIWWPLRMQAEEPFGGLRDQVKGDFWWGFIRPQSNEE